MARRRANPEDSWLPERVYRNEYSYVYKPKGSRTTITLCKLDTPKHQVIMKWKEAYAEHYQPSRSLNELADMFFSSEQFLELKPRTQKDYKDRNAPRVLAVFGKMNRNKIRPEHVREYMDKRGQKSRTQANREHAFLSRLFQWGYERGFVRLNPCKGVRKFKENARTRYITDDEYSAVYEAGDGVVKKAMEIAYCCALRSGDILSMKREQLTSEGIIVHQQKNQTSGLREWSPRLKKAIELTLPGVQSTTYVVHNQNGQPLTTDAFSHRWRTAKRMAQANNPDEEFNFTFHDIKAKAVSDYEGNKQEFSGHKSPSMVAVYDRKLKRIKSL